MAPPKLSRRALALRRAASRKRSAAQLEKELELIEELDYPGYFLTMWEIVEYLPGELSSARAVARPRTRPSVIASASPPSIRCAWASVRALHLHGARRAAGYRSRHRARAPRRSDPARLPEVRPRPRRHGRQRDALPPALGGARCRQGARASRDRARSHGQVAVVL